MILKLIDAQVFIFETHGPILKPVFDVHVLF
jgi:hypothetical protein